MQSGACDRCYNPRVARPILVVEDDLAVLRAMCAALEPLGDVRAVDDATAGLSEIEEHPPDLLVCDLRLPDISGIELIAQARARHPDLPAILVTGKAEPRDIIEAINRAGVYRFLPKPLDLDDLIHTARSALAEVQLRRERERLHAELERSHAAMQVLYEATRELARASGRQEIVSAALTHLARAVPFELGAVMVAPPPARNASLYLLASASFDDETLFAFKDEALSRFAERAGAPLREHQVKVILLGTQIGGRAPVPARAEIAEAPLEVGGQILGLVQLMRSERPYASEEQRLLGVLAGQTAQAIRRDEELMESQRRTLELLVRSMADGVLMTGEDHEVTVANPAARRMLGIGPDEPVSVHSLKERLGFSPFDLARGWEESGAEVVREEIEVAGRTLHSIVSPVLDGSGRLAGVAVVLRDLTAEKELERRKEEFVSVVSHELRTPLASIAGSLDLVLRGYVGAIAEKQRHYVQMARDSCGRLNRIVDDLLDLSKYESGRLEVTFEKISLGTLLQEAVDKYQAAAIDRRISIGCFVADEATIAGDAVRITQVVNNLLSNALKFTPEGGRIEVMLLTSDALTDHVGFSIWNGGPTIDEADLERIFEKFSQLPAGRRKLGGTGLGLAISRGLVETHGGRLWAEPGVPDGVRFFALFPRLAGEPSPPALEDGARAAVADLAVPGMRPVLVADRDPATASLLRGVLERYGIPALTACGSDEMLAVARKRPLSLIALDPGLSDEGEVLLQILAHDPQTRHLPVILTGAAGPAARRVPAVERPFTGARFVREVSRALRAQAPGLHPRILLVDDDEGTRLVVSEVLEREGWEVETYARAEEAVASARIRPPDLAILDILLPESDGFEVARALGAGRENGPELIILTAHASLTHKVRAFREGASDYLVKPVDPQVLLERSRAALRKRQTNREWTPTTRLPGSYAIEREIRRRLAARSPFACLHVTVDELREFNEAYGYDKAEGVVHQVADLVREVLSAWGGPGDFAGHMQRDHFVVVAEAERADTLGQNLVEALSRVLPLYYDREDRARGYLSLTANGETRLAPLMSACVVAVVDPGERFLEPTEIFAAALQAKKRRKVPGHPAYLRDDPPATSKSARKR
jgi:signal transduction histidine kinase/GGDEF domain-containing protein